MTRSLYVPKPEKKFAHKEEEKVSFEVKLTFIATLLFFYPVALCFQIHKKPSVQFWLGHWTFFVGLFVTLWISGCHFALVTRALSKRHAAIFTILIPSAVLAVACQIQELRFRAAAEMLVALDCETFQTKARLERAWWQAHNIMQNCSTHLSKITGASAAETAEVLRLQDCVGFNQGMKQYEYDWAYLAFLEKEYHCAGWCSAQKPIWRPKYPVQDGCSLAAARVIGGTAARMGLQVTVYSGILLLSSSLILLLAPGLLGAGHEHHHFEH